MLADFKGPATFVTLGFLIMSTTMLMAGTLSGNLVAFIFFVMLVSAAFDDKEAPAE